MVIFSASCWCGTPPNTGTHAAHPGHDALHMYYRSGRLAYSFSGGGFLLPYFCGVVHQLQHMGLLKPGVTRLAGSSAGSLVAGCISAGLSVQQVLNSVLTVAADCRVNGVPKRLTTLLRAQLDKNLPEDAHKRCTGVAHIGITKIWPIPHSKVVSKFRSREDLISAMLASCHVPRLSDGNLTTKFRKSTVADGGITALIPMPHVHLPKHKHQHDTSYQLEHHTVKISCIPRDHIPHLPLLNTKEVVKDIAVGPDIFDQWPHSLTETINLGLRPGSHSFMQSLVHRGSRDVMAWVTHTGLIRHLDPQFTAPAPPLSTSVTEWDLKTAVDGGGDLSPASDERQDTGSRHATQPGVEC